MALFKCLKKWPNGNMPLNFNQQIEFELLDFIQQNYGPEVFSPGLERTAPIYQEYKEWVKSSHIKVTIVAGTNGKGQTAHTLSHLLHQSGLSVALWTSPHILSLRERFNFNSSDVDYEILREGLHQTHQFLKEQWPDLRVSFYEFLFLVFLRLASKNKIDHLILEVGLGGRLDAVNHFDADCSCITSISRDHRAILGNRFDLILSEKIAVSRRGKVLFTNFRSAYLNQLTKNYCEREGVLWRPLNVDKNQNYFEENQRMAKALFAYLEPSKIGDPNSEIPIFKGRREEMTFNENTLIFIGAHNIDGVRRMLELFDPEESTMPDYALISFSKRPINEVEVMLKTLVEAFGEKTKLKLASFEHPKALENNLILELQKNNKISKGLLDFVTDWKSDLKKSKNQKILVCGSYYFVGEVQRFIHSFS